MDYGKVLNGLHEALSLEFIFVPMMLVRVVYEDIIGGKCVIYCETREDGICLEGTEMLVMNLTHFSWYVCEFEKGYSVVLPEKLQTGKWNVYRSACSPFKLVTRFPDHPDIGTLHENFVHAVDTFRDYKYLGTRIRVDGTIGEYKWMTYGEAGTARAAIGSGLLFHGIPKGSCVGFYFINRPEWLIVDYACSAYSLVSVPLYDTLGPDAVKYIVNHADVKAIFCVPQTLNSLRGFFNEIPSVHLIVVYFRNLLTESLNKKRSVVGGMDNELPSLPPSTDIQIVTYAKLLSEGRGNPQPFSPPNPNDVATICYTSGTTGTPKDNMELMNDLVALRPTIFCSVPRLYNRIYAGAVKSSGPLKERLFNAAYNSKRQAIMNGIHLRLDICVFPFCPLLEGNNPSPLWDKLVFNKIKAKLGGRVRFFSSGASPLSPDILDFLKICFGGRVLEGYGMTESSCVISMMDEGDNLSGHVGSPNPACEIKLVDVPEMNYTSDDEPHPRGEICVRGPILFQGYYKDEVHTKEVLDEDGWLHTGDIGLWLPGGRLKIIDSLNSSLVAIVSVDQDVLKTWAATEGIKVIYLPLLYIAGKSWILFYKDLEQLCNDRTARAAVLSDMDAIGREAQAMLLD
ncbi:hypothetical protein Gogos_017439 [Gossypium gossypioides]|uniref:AMP-dependent synthetase/ligase domain-containing protein n=1 Tax=Gossypium gossypioides TaxID=34282 RepID=A0A7J9BAN2_GOSGO|nr:hypothetical protein [Gossypium gossypioides]